MVAERGILAGFVVPVITPMALANSCSYAVLRLLCYSILIASRDLVFLGCTSIASYSELLRDCIFIHAAWYPDCACVLGWGLVYGLDREAG